MNNKLNVKINNPISGDFYITMKEENTLKELINAIRDGFNARGTKINAFCGPVKVPLATTLKEMHLESLTFNILNETEYSKSKKMSPKEYSETEKPRGRKLAK